MTSSLQNAAHQIARWLANQTSEQGFPARTFYGEAFTLWLWQYFPGEFEAAAQKLKAAARHQLARQDREAHPEFNAWALLQYGRLSHQPATDFLPTLPPLNNTPNSNWLLLGTLVRLLWRQENGVPGVPTGLRWHTRLLLTLQQQADGLIRDDRLISRWLPIPFPYGRIAPTRLQKMPHLQKLSLQYHCFSLALLWDIWQISGWSFVKTAVQHGHQAIGRFILANGDSLYIGRGQQQIFGYGALIYFLASQAAAGNQAAANQLARVWSFVHPFQAEDGRFPLVLRAEESGYPKKVDSRDPRWLGWYSYNNLFDYLPFLGVQLARAAQLLPNFDPGRVKAEAVLPQYGPAIQVTRQFAFVRQQRWQMSLAAPGGALSQDQPMPYLCLQEKSSLPCFGGEAGDDQLYNLTVLPLPYLGLGNGRYLFLRHHLQWRFTPTTQQPIMLVGRGRWGSLHRFFTWDDHSILIEDHLKLTPQKLPAGVQMIYPLLFTAFQLAPLSNGRYHIQPAPLPLTLSLSGWQGRLEHISGYTPVGPVQTVREAVRWQPEARHFRRQYKIAWMETA